jgi:hypothetical protein
MKKYHKTIKFIHNDLIFLFINTVNKMYRVLSFHCKQRILERINDIESVGKFIREYKIEYEDILEYTFSEGIISKVLIRTRFDNERDIILSISNLGLVITCYLNNRKDKHSTLNKKQYACY